MSTVFARHLLVEKPLGHLALVEERNPRASCRSPSQSSVAADPNASISDAGLVPARAGQRTGVDQFLLNEPLIQRTGPLAVDRRVSYVDDRRPDMVILASRDPDRLRGVYPTDRAMAHDRRFAGFALAHVARGAGHVCAYHLFLYRRAGGGVG